MTTPAPRVLPPLGAVQMTLNLVQQGQEAAVVLGGFVDSGGLTDAARQAWRDAAWNSFRTVILSEVTCAGATVRVVSRVGGEVWELGAPATQAGAVTTGTVNVAAACTLIKWGTVAGGRSGKGRTFWPGLSGNAMNPGGRTYTPAHASTTNTAITNYLSHAAFSTVLKPAVLSFTKGTAHVITTGAISPIIGMQRRRMR